MSSQVENRGSQVDMNKFLLDHNYHPNGSILRLQDHTEFYATGNPRSKHGIVVVPDTMGWNTGRIRNIADFFGENGFFVVIPKLSGSTTEGEGKGPSLFEASGIGDYMKGLTYDGNLKPKINSLVKFLNDEGVDKISLLGFSWGGWVVMNVLADSTLANKFVCAALPHPSINLEERMFGGSLPDLFSSVERPILLLPTKGDPEEYASYVKLLRYKLPTSDVISSYRNLEHGFLLRGRIEDRDIQQGCQQSLQQILSYFQYHSQANLNDFVREAVKGSVLGGKSELGGGRPADPVGAQGSGGVQETWNRWSQEASDTMNRWGQSIQDTTNYYQQQASQTVQSTQDQAQQLGHQMQEGYGQTKDQANQLGQRVQDATGQWVDQAKQSITQGQERVHEGYEQAKEKLNEYGQSAQEGSEQIKRQAGETYQQGKERMQQGYDQTKAKANEYGQRAQEGWDQAKQQSQETYDQTKGKASEYGQRAQEGSEQIKQQAGDTYKERVQQGHDQNRHHAVDNTATTNDKGQEHAQRSQEEYDQAKHHAKEAARETGQRIGENVKHSGEKIKQSSGGSPRSLSDKSK